MSESRAMRKTIFYGALLSLAALQLTCLGGIESCAQVIDTLRQCADQLENLAEAFLDGTSSLDRHGATLFVGGNKG